MPAHAVPHDLPTACVPPSLSPSEREDLIDPDSDLEHGPERLLSALVRSHAAERGAAEARCAELQGFGIHARVDGGVGDEIYHVDVSRKHLLLVMVLRELKDRNLVLTALSYQPLAVRQQLLVDALLATAKKSSGAFKCCLIPQEALTWYQGHSGLTDEQMRSSLAKTLRTFRDSKIKDLIIVANIGVLCILLGWKWAQVDFVFALFLGLPSAVFCLKWLVDLMRSDTEWTTAPYFHSRVPHEIFGLLLIIGVFTAVAVLLWITLKPWFGGH